MVTNFRPNKDEQHDSEQLEKAHNMERPVKSQAKHKALKKKMSLGDRRVAAGMSRKEPKYLKNPCATCGREQIGLHHHEK